MCQRAYFSFSLVFVKKVLLRSVRETYDSYKIRKVLFFCENCSLGLEGLCSQ